jgi:hypothetical protein
VQFCHTTQCHRCLKLREHAIGILTARMSTRAVAREYNLRLKRQRWLMLITIRHLWCFRRFDSTSNQHHHCRPCVSTPAQDLHIRHLHLQDRLWPATRTTDETVGMHNQNISAQIVLGKLICVLVAPDKDTWFDLLTKQQVLNELNQIRLFWTK